MDRKRSHRLAIALIVTTFATSIALAVVTFAGFAETATGDVNASGSFTAANLVVVLLGSVMLLGLELARTSAHREMHRPIEAQAQS